MAITEISALISGIKATIDIAKGLKSAHDSHTIVQAQSDILEQLTNLRMDALTLQEKTSALIQEKEQLAKKLVEMDEWKITKSQYKLEEISTGSFVYIPNESHPSPNPVHWLCQNCLDNKRQKSILQLQQKTSSGTDIYMCPACQAIVKDRSHPKTPPPPKRFDIKW